MKRWVVVALLLAGCTGNITFRRVDLAFMVEEEKARYNGAAALINRACTLHALTVEECQAATDAGKDAVKEYAALKKQLLAKETVTADSIMVWLLVIGTAVAHAYGIPVPNLLGGPVHAAPAPQMPTMP